MNIKTLAAIAAVLSAGLPALASAETTEPVTIESSMVEPQITDATRNETGSATVSFVNRGTVAATEVDFTLSSNGEALETLRDVGTFAPNVTIRHDFANDQVARDQQLSVAMVKFADGSVWVNDAPLPAGQRAVHDWMANGLDQ